MITQVTHMFIHPVEFRTDVNQLDNGGNSNASVELITKTERKYTNEI